MGRGYRDGVSKLRIIHVYVQGSQTFNKNWQNLLTSDFR